VRIVLKPAQFRRGQVCIALKEEERLYFLKQIKKCKAKGELEKRILKRLVMKFMGLPTHNFPLLPPRECPVCENQIRGDRYDAHVRECQIKREAEKRIPKIDPAVYEMLGRPKWHKLLDDEVDR